MRVKSVASLYVVLAILFIMAVAAEVFVDAFVRTSSLFNYLLVTTIVTGVITSAIVEKVNAKILV